MAFTGVAVVQQISDQKVRITGLLLEFGAVGTIGLFGDAGAGVQLPDGFNPTNYQAFGALVDLADSLEVSFWSVEDGNGVDDIVVTKGGAPFRITMTNASLDEANDSEMEIYVAFHD